MKYAAYLGFIMVLYIATGCKKKESEIDPLSYAPKLAGERTWSVQVDYTLSWAHINTREQCGYKKLAITVSDPKHIVVAGTNLTFLSLENERIIYNYSSGVPDWISRKLIYAYAIDSIYYGTMGYDAGGGRFDTTYSTHL